MAPDFDDGPLFFILQNAVPSSSCHIGTIQQLGAVDKAIWEETSLSLKPSAECAPWLSGTHLRVLRP